MTVTGPSQQHRRASGSGFTRLVNVVCLLAFLAALAYLVFKILQVSNHPGYDFKYLWLAGETWLRGLNAYSEHYELIGEQLQLPGYIPVSFYYPPNWILPASLLALTDPTSAFFFWNCFNILALLGSSLLLSLVFRDYFAAREASGVLSRWLAPVTGSVVNLFCVHVFFIAIFQATAITLSNGQTSILIYLGVSLLLYGVKYSKVAALVGLSILWLKPQLGVVFTLGLLLQGRQHWRLIAYTAVIAIVLSLPALYISPLAPLEWLAKIGQYDNQLTAHPPEMTGIRHLVSRLSGYDPGNMSALVMTMLALPGLVWVSCGFADGRKDTTQASYSQKAIFLASACLTAIGPLHLYDFLLVAVYLYVIALGSTLAFAIGALGCMVLLRAEDVAAYIGFYSPETLYYKGSCLATLAAWFILLAVCMTFRMQMLREKS